MYYFLAVVFSVFLTSAILALGIHIGQKNYKNGYSMGFMREKGYYPPEQETKMSEGADKSENKDKSVRIVSWKDNVNPVLGRDEETGTG